MTTEEAAWLAGVLEGEGCFDLNRGDSRYPRVRVEMTDRDIIVRIKALVGGGSILEKPGKQVQHSTTYNLQIAAMAQVQKLFEAILPWMGIRRGKQIRLLMENAGWAAQITP